MNKNNKIDRGNKIKIFKPEKSLCLCNRQLFLSRAGIPFSKQNQFQNLSKIMDRIYFETINFIKPEIYYADFDLEELNEKIIPSSFFGVKKITIFISTLGNIFDDYINDLLKKNKIFETFVADSFGSESLEKLNRYFDRRLKKDYKRRTRRFSPGYSDVDIKINKVIVENLFKLKKIKVLDSGEILPRKTTICMIGWYL